MINYLIKGKSGKEYIFNEQLITEQSADAPIGIYVLAHRIKDITISENSFYKSKHLFGIDETGKAMYNPTGHATTYLFYKCETTEEVKEILVDLEEDDTFKINITDLY